MFSFFRKESLVKRAAFMGAVLVLLTGFLFVSCSQPIDSILPVNARQPSISGQPQGGDWDVASENTFDLTVTASVTDGGQLSYQWYSNSSDGSLGSIEITTGGASATLSLAKADYTANGDYYFYVIVTNTISDNGDGGTKTASKISDVAQVTVDGVGGVHLNAQKPVIETQPAGTFWNVFTAASGVKLTVEADVTDGGILSYQWYSNTSASAVNGTKIDTATGKDYTLTKTVYTTNGTYYFYVIITNTNDDITGTKTVSTASDAVTVTVVGYPDTGYSDIHTLPSKLTGEWESEYGEIYTINAGEFSSGADWGDGWSEYKGTIVNHRGNAEGTAGYITIQYTQNDWDETAENKYYVIYYKDLTETTVTIAGAGSFTFTDPDFGASGGRATKDEAEATYTVSAGYFAMGSDLVKNVIPEGIQISSQEDIAKIGVAGTHPINGTYVLMNNITVTNWKPIGDTTTPFSGKFNGNRKTITLSGFDSAALSGTNLGFFAAVKGASSSNKAEIKNLKIQAALPAGTKTTTGNRIGLVAGTVQDAVIEDITLSGTFNIESSILVNLGGIAGTITGAGTVVKDCNSTMEMNIIPGSGGGGSYSYIGGFVGQFASGAGVENCHYNGNITADNLSSSAGAGQVFAGGIANCPYGFVTGYQGYIEDCSFTGTLLAKNGSMWTYAGGIAACNVGGTVNDYSQTTRIVRCYVEGTVSVEGTTAGNPYVGGVVGYNYYGALVSQCYFNGTVIAAKTGDYTGGIAGYNSQTGAPNNSRIEDCWSAGEVKGFNNAGGIVGQNQVNTYIRRCYSTAAISVTNQAGTGIGGIAGMNASAQTDAITACVALNQSLTAPKGNNINRVTGTTGGNRSNNHAWNMPIDAGTGTYTERKGGTDADGADCAEKPAQSFYTGLGWDFSNVWKMGADYPKLKWQP